MVYYDINHVNISVINGARFIKFGTVVAGCHLEATVSQIFYLGPSLYFVLPT